MACLWEEHREYTKTRREWEGKLHRTTGTLAWERSGKSRQPARTQEMVGRPRSPECAIPMNGYLLASYLVSRANANGGEANISVVLAYND